MYSAPHCSSSHLNTHTQSEHLKISSKVLSKSSPDSFFIKDQSQNQPADSSAIPILHCARSSPRTRCCSSRNLSRKTSCQSLPTIALQTLTTGVSIRQKNNQEQMTWCMAEAMEALKQVQSNIY